MDIQDLRCYFPSHIYDYGEYTVERSHSRRTGIGAQ
jgi:hypothetical protein